jgi:HSP20 family protein
MAEKAKEKETKAVTPWRPFMDLTRWERDMERMVEDFFGRRMRPWFPRAEGMEMTAPAVDVYEEKDDIIVKAELPGMEKDNIEVNLADHMLTIKGEKKKEEEVKEESYYRSERFHGSFLRTVDLPKDVHGIRSRRPSRMGFWR